MSSDRPQTVTPDPGRSEGDEPVVIDRSIAAERWRYTCPEGHTDWYPTNNHVWCKGCRRAIEAGHDDLDAEYEYVVDQKSGEPVHWTRVELVAREDADAP